MKIKYRPEIDGLRAIAVGAVILYHAQINISGYNIFKGGFIGVDVFFVISGYLISSIILKELISNGSFSFKHFYERRVRRILPALLFLMLVSLPFAWLFLLPNSLIDFSKSILYSLIFSSNFYFHYSGQIYGAEDGLLKPYLHTWSLSVEEQFYVLFPIILLLLFKWLRKHFIYILIFGFIISLGLAEWTSKNYPSRSFYFIHTRMWELLAGSILAYFEIIKGHRSKNQLLNLVLPTIGLVLISHSIIFFDSKIFHPSFYTLSPIVGVCLIIWFSDKNEFITKILSTKLFVGIGLISYSLYLWHYPIFSFIRITGLGDGSILLKLLIALSIIIISFFSYYFIEKPFRNKKFEFKFLLTIIVSLLFILISFNFYVIYHKGIDKRLPEIFQKELKKENVNFYQKDDVQKVVLLGDSHAKALAFNLNEGIKKNNLSLFRFNTEMYLTGFNQINKKTKKANSEFVNINNNIADFLDKNSNLIVVFHQRWAPHLLERFFDNHEGYKEQSDLEFDKYLEPINFETSSIKERQQYIKEGLISQINSIINKGHKLVLIYPVPELGVNLKRYLFREYIFNRSEFKNSIPIFSGSYEVYKNRNKLVFEILDSIESPNIYRIYPHKFFCDKQIKNRCIGNNQDNLFYYDDDHLSIQGSKIVTNEIINVINKIKN